ncbi:MAG: DUF3187 family protein [Pseudomonadota bacterium]
MRAGKGMVIWLGALAGSTSALAEPVSAADRYPLSRLFVPPAVTSADFTNGHRPFTLDVDWGTFATQSTGRTELLIYDGEFVTTTGRWQWQRGAWRFGLDVPAVYQSGGMLDRLIDEFHQLFGLPEGDRPVQPIDALQLFYTDEQGTRFDVRGDDWGLGETHLHVGRSLRQTPKTVSAWRAHLKLPTGSTRRLLGSGTVGAGVEWHAMTRSEWRGRGLTWFGGAGVQWQDGSDVLPDRVKRVAAFGHVGGRLFLRPALSAVVQVDFHTPYFDSGLDGIENAYAITFGGRWQRARGDAFEFTVYEDIVPRSVPDVVFQFRWLSSTRKAP